MVVVVVSISPSPRTMFQYDVVPDDVWLAIFAATSAEDVARVACTCRLFAELANDEMVRTCSCPAGLALVDECPNCLLYEDLWADRRSFGGREV